MFNLHLLRNPEETEREGVSREGKDETGDSQTGRRANGPVFKGTGTETLGLIALKSCEPGRFPRKVASGRIENWGSWEV